MLHHFTDKGPWFRAKRFGYGAGLPFKWQGWVLLLSHMALIIGLALLLADRPLIFVQHLRRCRSTLRAPRAGGNGGAAVRGRTPGAFKPPASPKPARQTHTTKAVYHVGR
jgi:hypothetical protein